MIEIPRPTDKELEEMNEKLYKMYIIKNRADYEGSIMKYECVINNERGLFKERLNTQSKDHVMEQLAFELATILGVHCCKASCRKSNGVYGSFSRYEVIDLDNVYTFASMVNTTDMQSDEFIESTIRLSHGKINNFVVNAYQYILFDFILGQMDRHLDNLSLYKNKRGVYVWYPLYDNGFCCFATYANDAAIESLNKEFYSSRMGLSADILRTLRDYRDRIYPGDLNDLIKYKQINKELIYRLLDKSDKYNQINKNRRKAIVDFIYKQLKYIHLLNNRRLPECI